MNHAWPDRMSGGEVFAYVRHKPEQTLLYQLIERHWPEFQSHLSEAGSYLPRHVTREFDEYLECGRLEYGFLRVRCEDCHHEQLVAFSCKRRGFCRGRPAPVAAQGAWWKPLHCWWMTSYLINPSANGCSAFLIPCDFYLPVTHRLSLMCWVSSTG
jgi:hypothetical protein